ncbi:MAG: response regulator, partial [Bacteroidota bacterium]
GIREKHQLVLEHLEKEKNEELQQMKLRFFTNISHELRTPLSLISGPMDFLIQSGHSLDYENREKQYVLIRKNANYLLRLVNQLLDFRKIDQGIVQLKVRCGDIVSYVKEISEPFEFIASKKDINFEVIAEQPECMVWFDRSIVEKAVYNLLSNAFKYTPAGGNIRLEIRKSAEGSLLTRRGLSKNCLEIRVRDTGLGIPDKQKEKVFDRFFKVGENDKNNPAGVGIGLSYTRELVRIHHGKIWAEDNDSQGACFVVQLPLSGKAYGKKEKCTEKLAQSKAYSPSVVYDPALILEQEQLVNGNGHAALHTNGHNGNGHDPHEEVQADQEKANEALANGKRSMLIIDDNPDIRSFLHDAFKAEYKILEAVDGIAGWEMAQAHTPDLILSDVMMPGRNGIELCHMLKEDPLTSHIPIVLLTAKISEESELEGLRNGADGYIRKPFKLDLLTYKIHNILASREELQKRFRKEVILEPKEITVTSTDEIFLQKAMDLIEENMTDTDFNVEALAREIAMSRSKLYLKLKALTGQSSSEFIRTVKLKRAVQLLESSDLTVKEIMFMTGFNTASYFSKCFKKQFGVVPSEYVRQ